MSAKFSVSKKWLTVGQRAPIIAVIHLPAGQRNRLYSAADFNIFRQSSRPCIVLTKAALEFSCTTSSHATFSSNDQTEKHRRDRQPCPEGQSDPFGPYDPNQRRLTTTTCLKGD